MPKITDEGIVIYTRPLSEGKMIVSVFTQNHGRVSGMMRCSKKNLIDLLTCGKITWNARLSEHLGVLTCEATTSPLAHIYGEYVSLLCVQSFCALLYRTLSEHHPYPMIYRAAEDFRKALAFDNVLRAYIRFEMLLLKELGFALDLDTCAATGVRDNLCYISPKSGRAVSKNAGLPYHVQLLPLPYLLRNTHGNTLDFHGVNSNNMGEDKDALRVLHYFLEKHLLSPLPLSRTHLAQSINMQSKKTKAA